jgi:short-subunit dehydrogenase
LRVGYSVRKDPKWKLVSDVLAGEIAVITGASSGLGAEFARQLAARGYNLVLTARRADRLEQLGSDLHSRFSIAAQIQPADLSKLPDIDALITTITGLPRLDLLVNNAGFGTVGRFYRVDPEKELAMVNVHMVAPVMLTRAVLPEMVSRDHGGIINVSSMAGLVPIRNVLYHSSKSFQVSFSETLRSELYGTHVHIQALCPGFVMTEFHDTPEYKHFSRKSIPNFLWMTPAQVVSDSLDSLPRGKLICTPGGIYRFAAILARNSLSAGLIKYFAGIIVNRHKAL